MARTPNSIRQRFMNSGKPSVAPASCGSKRAMKSSRRRRYNDLDPSAYAHGTDPRRLTLDLMPTKTPKKRTAAIVPKKSTKRHAAVVKKVSPTTLITGGTGFLGAH